MARRVGGDPRRPGRGHGRPHRDRRAERRAALERAVRRAPLRHRAAGGGGSSPCHGSSGVWDASTSTTCCVRRRRSSVTGNCCVPTLEPGRALDFATGDGRNALWLARNGWRVTAIDFSQVALDRAHRSADAAGVNVDGVLADLLEWRPPVRAFDLVAIVFLHLPADERRRAYAAACGAVAPGGRLMVIGHDRSNLAEGSGGPQDPAVLFTADEIAHDLPGLTVERAERVVHEPPDEARTIDAVLVAIRPPDLTRGAPSERPGPWCERASPRSGRLSGRGLVSRRSLVRRRPPRARDRDVRRPHGSRPRSCPGRG